MGFSLHNCLWVRAGPDISQDRKRAWIFIIDIRGIIQYTRLRYIIFHFQTNRRSDQCPMCDNANIVGCCLSVYKWTH